MKVVACGLAGLPVSFAARTGPGAVANLPDQ